MSLIYPNHIRILKPKRLVQVQRPQILEPQGSVWALDFDPTGNEHVNIASKVVFNPLNDFSIIASLYIDNLAASIAFFSEGTLANFFPFIGIYAISNGKQRVITRNDANASFSIEADNATLSTGNWFLYGLTKTGSTWNFYTDATKQTKTQSLSGTYNDLTKSAIGVVGRDTLINFFNGKIRFLYIYNRTLSSTEVLRHVENSQLESDRRGLIGEWRLQEGFGTANGTQIRDRSGQENHGSMQGFSGNPWVNVGVR